MRHGVRYQDGFNTGITEGTEGPVDAGLRLPAAGLWIERRVRKRAPLDLKAFVFVLSSRSTPRVARATGPTPLSPWSLCALCETSLSRSLKLRHVFES